MPNRRELAPSTLSAEAAQLIDWSDPVARLRLAISTCLAETRRNVRDAWKAARLLGLTYSQLAAETKIRKKVLKRMLKPAGCSSEFNLYDFMLLCAYFGVEAPTIPYEKRIE